MGVDYREQYKPEHLEPFFPHEIFKMLIVVLSTLAVLMFLVVLPTALESAGLTGIFHEEQPADPGVTPPHIRPEWYFLAVYQYLKLMPPEVLGMDGKALGIFSQMVVMAMVVLLPFWFPLRSAQLETSAWRKGLGVFALMLATFITPAGILIWVRSRLPDSYHDVIHPMFVWPVLAAAAYVMVGMRTKKTGFTDAFKWLKIYTTALLLISFQFLAFIAVLGQGLSWAIPSTLAYLLGAIGFGIATVLIIDFIRRRVCGQDDKLRVKILAVFITEGMMLFVGLTIWAMWPAGGVYSEHGWHHEAKGFIFSVIIIFLAAIIFYAFLTTERRTIRRTLSLEERDKIT